MVLNQTLENDSDENENGEDDGNGNDAGNSERKNGRKQEDDAKDSADGCDCSTSRSIHARRVIPKAKCCDEQENTEQKFDDHCDFLLPAISVLVSKRRNARFAFTASACFRFQRVFHISYSVSEGFGEVSIFSISFGWISRSADENFMASDSKYVGEVEHEFFVAFVACVGKRYQE